MDRHLHIPAKHYSQLTFLYTFVATVRHMILIDGLFINKGGGAVLLQYLIDKLMEHPKSSDFFFLLDPRFDIPPALTSNYLVIPNKMSERIRFYKQRRNDFSRVFCFANTPPPVKLKVPVYTYHHNQKLLDVANQPIMKRNWRMYLKYFFIKMYNSNTDYYVVQTPHMVKEFLKTGLKDAAHCLTIPFYNADKYKTGATTYDSRPANQFAFVSTPSPQKNYPTLLDAWEYLHLLGHTPGLHITIDETAPVLLARIDEMKAKGIQIFNYSYIDPRELYFKYRYLVCPSITESFGLPLIEAVESGMKVLAPELPYVYDVIQPSLTFDAMDKVSIANAVLAALDRSLPFPAIVTQNKVHQLIDVIVGG